MNITCKICGETKDESQFYPAVNNKTGRRTFCKKCEMAKTKIVKKASDITDENIFKGFLRTLWLVLDMMYHKI